MDDSRAQNVNNIYSLPYEIIVIILLNNSPRDILNFGATCKQFNEIVKGHKYLWKYICAATFPPILYEVFEKNNGNNWLHEMKYYSKLKQELHSELIAMSAVHYWKLSEMSLDNVSHFFSKLAKTNFFYAVYILQEVIKTGNKFINRHMCIQPYTLTEIYYSKAVLRYYMHTYLAVKWAKAKLKQDLPPELVLNFFLQWIDPANLYLDEEVEKKINFISAQVNDILVNCKKGSKGHSGMQIIQAVTQVIYKQRHMVVTTATNVDTLNICKVIDNNFGNVIVVAAIYQAVATRCGACCKLIVFSNHLFLEWNERNPLEQEPYNIDLETGDIFHKRQCPCGLFQCNQTSNYSYCPDSLLQCIYSSFIVSMGELRTWNTQNAMFLLDVIGTENEHSAFKHSPYKNYFSYLMENEIMLKQCDNVNIKQLSDEYIELITYLAGMNIFDEVPSKKKIAKKHVSCVKLAVGMICYHKRYNYVCIIRGWDLTGCQLHFPLDDLYFGHNQPFYFITAADQSERYVAQENLMELTRPTRLFHLEHQISADFTHFDGFAYVPNEQKRFEYPDDQPIVEMYRIISQYKPNNIQY